MVSRHEDQCKSSGQVKPASRRPHQTRKSPRCWPCASCGRVYVSISKQGSKRVNKNDLKSSVPSQRNARTTTSTTTKKKKKTTTTTTTSESVRASVELKHKQQPARCPPFVRLCVRAFAVRPSVRPWVCSPTPVWCGGRVEGWTVHGARCTVRACSRTERLTAEVAGWLAGRTNEQTNKWTNERTNKQTNERMNERTNE